MLLIEWQLRKFRRNNKWKDALVISLSAAAAVGGVAQGHALLIQREISA